MRDRFGGCRRSGWPAPSQPWSSDPTDNDGGFETGWRSRTGQDVGVPTAVAGAMYETHRGYEGVRASGHELEHEPIILGGDFAGMGRLSSTVTAVRRATNW